MAEIAQATVFCKMSAQNVGASQVAMFSTICFSTMSQPFVASVWDAS